MHTFYFHFTVYLFQENVFIVQCLQSSNFIHQFLIIFTLDACLISFDFSLFCITNTRRTYLIMKAIIIIENHTGTLISQICIINIQCLFKSFIISKSNAEPVYRLLQTLYATVSNCFQKYFLIIQFNVSLPHLLHARNTHTMRVINYTYKQYVFITPPL